MAFWDISRAHFYGKAERDAHITLPEEEYESGFCGKLERTMYGTQDASHIWQEDYSANLEGAGYKRGVSNGAVFLNEDQDSRCLVHGDDFVLIGDEEAIKHMHALLSRHFDLKMTGKIGFDEADEREAVMLNRVLRCVPESEVFEIEADQRHAEIIIDELGLTGGKSVTTPIVKKKNEEVIADAKLPAVKAEKLQDIGRQPCERSISLRAALTSM